MDVRNELDYRYSGTFPRGSAAEAPCGSTRLPFQQSGNYWQPRISSICKTKKIFANERSKFHPAEYKGGTASQTKEQYK
jgi:hypothetical protein